MDWTGFMVFLLVVGLILSYALLPYLKARYATDGAGYDDETTTTNDRPAHTDVAMQRQALPAAQNAPAVPPGAGGGGAAASVKLLPTINLQTLAKMAQAVPHVAIIGDTGAGKTTLAEALIRLLNGQIAIIDPKWKQEDPPRWGGLPATPIDDEGGYTLINTALQALWDDFKSRIVRSKNEQGYTPEPLMIIWDEINDTIEELPEAGKLVRRWARLAREYQVKMLIFPQSDRVEALGLKGHGDARKNFLWVYLGNDARKIVKDLFDQRRISAAQYQEFQRHPRPGVVEWRGDWCLIDSSTALEIKAWPMAEIRAWRSGVPRSEGIFSERSEGGNAEREEPGTPTALSDIEDAAIRYWISVGKLNEEIATLMPGKRRATRLVQIKAIRESMTLNA